MDIYTENYKNCLIGNLIQEILPTTLFGFDIDGCRMYRTDTPREYGNVIDAIKDEGYVFKPNKTTADEIRTIVFHMKDQKTVKNPWIIQHLEADTKETGLTKKQKNLITVVKPYEEKWKSERRKKEHSDMDKKIVNMKNTTKEDDQETKMTTTLVVPTDTSEKNDKKEKSKQKEEYKYAELGKEYKKVATTSKISKRNPVELIGLCPDLANTPFANDKLKVYGIEENGNISYCMIFDPANKNPGVIVRKFKKTQMGEAAITEIIGNRQFANLAIIKTIWRTLKENLPKIEADAEHVDGRLSVLETYRYVVLYALNQASEGVKNFSYREIEGKKLVCIDGNKTLQEALDHADYNIKATELMKQLSVGIDGEHELILYYAGRYSYFNDHVYTFVINEDLLKDENVN